MLRDAVRPPRTVLVRQIVSLSFSAIAIFSGAGSVFLYLNHPPPFVIAALPEFASVLAVVRQVTSFAPLFAIAALILLIGMPKSQERGTMPRRIPLGAGITACAVSILAANVPTIALVLMLLLRMIGWSPFVFA